MQSFASSAIFLVDKKKGPSGPFLMMSYSQLTELVEVIENYCFYYLKRIERSIALRCLVKAPTEM